MTHDTNEKAPDAINTEGLTTDTTNDLNFATGTQNLKAIATQFAELAIWGHAVHQLKGGGFLGCRCGHTFHTDDFETLQAFLRRLGVMQ